MSVAAMNREEVVAARVRVVTAASLFDGHDAAINIVRRVLQQLGAEVIHLGHDRSVEEIVAAAVQEDAHAVAVSSYQGGHMEFFRYLAERLREVGAGHVQVYGGGGGTFTQEEIDILREEGVARIFGPEEGRRLGLEGMIGQIIEGAQGQPLARQAGDVDTLCPGEPMAVARLISWLEAYEPVDAPELESLRAALELRAKGSPIPVVGLTGTGGAGKSSVVDELVRRFRLDFPSAQIALLLVDPTRRRSGGALLGDRIRLNAVHGEGVFVRSMATRQANRSISQSVEDAVRVLKAASFDLVIVETAGIGQSDSEIVDHADLSLYVMTPEYGAPSQLEKIDMLDLAELVVLNKFDRQGGADALRDIRKQWRRNHDASGSQNLEDADLPVFPTVARDWHDAGTSRLYEALRRKLAERGGSVFEREPREITGEIRSEPAIAKGRVRYLAEIADSVRGYRERSLSQARLASKADGLGRVLADLGPEDESLGQELRSRYDQAWGALEPGLRGDLEGWGDLRSRYLEEEQEYNVRGRGIRVRNQTRTLSDTEVQRVSIPDLQDWGDRVRYLQLENRPGSFPFTAGVFPFKRQGEDPARMFAGEGGPEATNRRFHLLAAGQPAARLSTAFDSVTLYGRNPDRRPDIYGKVGNSGVSIPTLDDAKKLYSGFDLCDPSTSVSLTINGPAPTVLAFFLNAAIDQQVEKHLRETGELSRIEEVRGPAGANAAYGEALPDGHSGLGLALLGIPGDRVVPPDVYVRIRKDVLHAVRGTVQADVLKEDQAQNTCIFSTEFSLKVMGDIQKYFTANEVKNFYSVSISGYHIAEAGANPISQLAFTLANGFTYCEHYLARGMSIDDFAPNFSFFFSSGLDAEYSVLGRVARRIWAVAMRERYEASERSQKLKYHMQTSGRSLHAQEMAFNDIRTTLQALTGLQDQCNSLHTNAYDEAVTTPTAESVRRALAIQLIINREFGPSRNENSLQGSYWLEDLTDRVEEAVLQEFERINERGGVLGAMETNYQRGRIQEESMLYESQKHSGELPVIGVNTFLDPDSKGVEPGAATLRRATAPEKDRQLANLGQFHEQWEGESAQALRALRECAERGENVFAELMETVKVASLGQISEALFQAGGSYRRSM